MIQHTVAFRLNSEADTDAFLAKAEELAAIDGVVDFEVLRQVGTKNAYTHALSMHFADQAAYDDYNDHPRHRDFVRDTWVSQVEDFIELDYVRNDG